jgi:shikimate dehydrogenase
MTSDKTYRLGLIGYPLAHSLSPRLHQTALESLGMQGEYRLYPVPPENRAALVDLVGRLRRGELDGLNVTIPFKQTVLPLLDRLSPAVQSIGAVNTICRRNGRLVGENTDAPGFWADLGRFLTAQAPGGQGKALVLGAGGAARAVVHALGSHGWQVTLAVRPGSPEKAAALVKDFQDAPFAGSLNWVALEAASLLPLLGDIQLVVNATPVGMPPEIDCSPWPAELPFPRTAGVYDLIYDPRETALVRQATAAGLRATTGMGMLVEQAVRSFEIWSGQAPSREALWRAVEAG